MVPLVLSATLGLSPGALADRLAEVLPAPPVISLSDDLPQALTRLRAHLRQRPMAAGAVAGAVSLLVLNVVAVPGLPVLALAAVSAALGQATAAVAFLGSFLEFLAPLGPALATAGLVVLVALAIWGVQTLAWHVERTALEGRVLELEGREHGGPPVQPQVVLLSF